MTPLNGEAEDALAGQRHGRECGFTGSASDCEIIVITLPTKYTAFILLISSHTHRCRYNNAHLERIQTAKSAKIDSNSGDAHDQYACVWHFPGKSKLAHRSSYC